jgi:hypothetical protein
VTTDKAGPYLRVLDELVPTATHVTEQYADNRVEADHARLKPRLRPMRGLTTTPTGGTAPSAKPRRPAEPRRRQPMISSSTDANGLAV